MIHVLCIMNIFFPKFYRYCSIIYELKVCNCQQWTNSWLAWVCGPACSMELYQWNTTDNYDCQTCQSLAKRVVGNVDIGIWWNSINRIIQYNVEWLFMLLTSISYSQSICRTVDKDATIQLNAIFCLLLMNKIILRCFLTTFIHGRFFISHNSSSLVTLSNQHKPLMGTWMHCRRQIRFLILCAQGMLCIYIHYGLIAMASMCNLGLQVM